MTTKRQRETTERPAQGCGEEFNVKGHGKGDNKKDAIDDAHKDAEETAKLLCTDPNCKTPKFQRYESVDPVKTANGKYEATTDEVFVCE